MKKKLRLKKEIKAKFIELLPLIFFYAVMLGGFYAIILKNS